MRIGAAVKRAGLGALCGALLALGIGAPTAQAAFDDPLFLYRPLPPAPPALPIPPPAGDFEGPCGLAVDNAANFYVSDYYHHAIDLFSPAHSYLSQLANEDPLDGPCALAFDAAANLYVNNFHRNVVRIAAGFGAATTIAGVGVDETHPTGVAVNKTTNDVYVDERTQLAVFDSTGTAKGTIGVGTLNDGYGLAVSEFPATEGLLYVPDAASDTVKVYEPTLGAVNPVATIDGSGTPLGHFVSLRNSAIAVDNASGEIYVADILKPEYSELSETVIHVFDAAGSYEGRLKYSIENALPPGLAVDNSETATQGRVYVTTGNTELAAVYAYPAHAATSTAVPLPSAPAGSGGGGGGSGAGATQAPAAAAAAAPAPPVADSSDPAGAVSPAAGKPSRERQASRRDRVRHRKAAKRRAAKRHHRAQKGNR